MKKTTYIIIILCFILFTSCSKDKNKQNVSPISESTSKDITSETKANSNIIFTDDYFKNVTRIKAIPHIGKREITEEEDILKVCQLFASLEFTEQQQDDSSEVILGTSVVTFYYKDNTEFDIVFTSKYLYYGDMIYTLVPEQSDNLFAELHNIFSD